MSRVDLQVKIEGPYAHKSGYRCRVVLPTGLRKWCPSAPSREAAIEVGRQAAELQELQELHEGANRQPVSRERATSLYGRARSCSTRAPVSVQRLRACRVAPTRAPPRRPPARL